MGRTESRASANLVFSSTGSRKMFVVEGWPSASFVGVSRSGFGVPVPSGPGLPATDERGVFSASVRRERRLKGFGTGRWGVETTGSVEVMPFSVAAVTGLPAAASRTAI